MLVNKRPTDLSERIKARLSGDSNAKANTVARTARLFQDSELDAALSLTEQDMRGGYGALDRTGNRKGIVARFPGSASVPWVARFAIVISGLAALLLIGLLAFNIVWNGAANSSSQLAEDGTTTKANVAAENNSEVGQNTKPSTENTLAGNDASAHAPPIAKEPSSPALDQPNASAPDLSAQNLVADSKNNASSSGNQDERTTIKFTEQPNAAKNAVVMSPPRSNSDFVQLSNAEIVGVINDQFDHLWKRSGVSAMPIVRDDEWLDRATIAIVGRLPTAAEKESYRVSKRDDRKTEFVDKLIESGEFASHWADVLAEHYLGYRVVGVRRQTTNQREFVRWIADSLSQRTFIGQIEQEMLGTAVPSTGTARSDAAAFWIAEIWDRSQAEYQESKSQLQRLSDAKQAGRIGLARQWMRVSGNATMACAQCHTVTDENREALGLLAVTGKASNRSGMDAFWQVPATLSGWSVARKGDGEREVTQSPGTSFYFEDSDGRLKVATAGLPTWNEPSSSKVEPGEWMKSALEPRRSFVDLVCVKVLGQPLVPVFGLSKDEGDEERRDLRDLLAHQFQGGQRDLGSLLRWLVLSKPFAVEAQTLDTPWYLKSSELQMAETQRQMRLFASSSFSKLTLPSHGKLPMNRVTAWTENQRTSDAANQALAQRADTSTATTKTSALPKPNYTEDQIRFLNSVARPYAHLNQLVERMASSSMKWPELVDHAYLVSDSRFPLKLERDEANKLLEASGRNRAKALLALIQARLGAH
jgi:hypothetical protein